MIIEQEHQQLIVQFYTAFQQLDAAEMISLYDDDVVFEDPAFGQLRGEEAKAMWKMLIERGKDSLKIEFYDVLGTPTGGTATWEARYLYSKAKRPVHNIIQAQFVIADGKIIKHTDQFRFWRWASQALGPTARVLGFTSFLRQQVRKGTREALDKYMAKG
ncbi:MAG: nuclear transport factor 2 family protein [Cyclobacteriaceae bacterium]